MLNKQSSWPCANSEEDQLRSAWTGVPLSVLCLAPAHTRAGSSHPASPVLSRARGAADKGVEKTRAEKAPPLPLSLLHRDNDRLSSHSDQHCHPQHRRAPTHTTHTHTHTLSGPTAVKIRTSLDNTDNQVTAVTSVIFTLGPDNTSKILLAMGTTRDHRIKPIRRHVSHQISNYLLFNIPN